MTNSEVSKKPVIVIAEDSRVQGLVLKQRLSAAGYESHIGFDGLLALELIHQHFPCVVISDIEMPRMTGYELCRSIKQDPSLKHIPVILLSTLADAEDIIRGLDVGADNYVTKPYEINYLISRVEALRSAPLIDADAEIVDSEISVTLGGRTYKVKSGRQQTLNLLISTFENAVEKNKELHRSNEYLILAKEKLVDWNAKLEALNSQLSEMNTRMTRDLHAAAKMQQSLLPNAPLDCSQVEIAWKYTPCDELAGDFLNYAKLDENNLALYVVDVSGHGTASALLAVAIGRVLSAGVSATSLLVRPDPFTGKLLITPPATVVGELNRRFQMDSQGGLHFTILYGVLDLRTNLFRYACGGHPQPVHQPQGQLPRFAEGDGLAVGWFDDIDFDDFTLQLNKGDRLFLYSDGVPEAMDANLEQLSNERMLVQINKGSSTPIEAQVLDLQTLVQQWCSPKGPCDDISILAVEIR
jgi:sigma-B regulation protein RsbU (phosphoserine phosphatase)